MKIALVTNALEFVGPPAVRALLDDGYEVLAHDPAFQDGETLERFEAENPGAAALTVEDPDALIESAWARHGRVDAIVSNDVHPAVHAPIEDADLHDLEATLAALIVFPFTLMRAAIPRLKAQRAGSVVMVTSCRTELPMPGGAIPDMARAAENALVRSLSLELAPFDVPVNAVAPNYLYSEAYFPKAKFIDDPDGQAFIRDVVPAGRLGRPDEIGRLVSYLANLEGSFHTGTTIKFAGGWPAAPTRPV